MNTIVLATDGSPSAGRAASTAIELARATGAPLHVVTAWTIPASAFGYAPYTVAPELGTLEREHAETIAGRAADEARAAGVEATWEARSGFPVEEICGVAEEQDAGLVVVGAHGWGALKRLFAGSVSTGVVHHAPCPVLVVRDGAEPAAADLRETRNREPVRHG